MTLAEEIKKIIEHHEQLLGECADEPWDAFAGVVDEMTKAIKTVCDKDVCDKDVCPSCDSTVDSQLISKCRKCKAVQCPKC